MDVFAEQGIFRSRAVFAVAGFETVLQVGEHPSYFIEPEVDCEVVVEDVGCEGYIAVY